jgi:ABC-type phosphate/phosphonate transport system substrate-binding protein
MTADEQHSAALVANARMYAIDERVAALWSRLFAWIAIEARIPLDVIAHAPPRPLAALWRRADLGCAFICGYPWTTWADPAIAQPRLLAAPVPSGARYAGRAVYCTDIVVRADSRHADIDALRGSRFAYTVEHSQSGYQAPRAYVADRAMRDGGHFFADVVGPLHTPRAVVAAVLAGRADAGPLDSWWHDLLERHEPATAARLRTIASTPMTPVPPLVAAAEVPEAIHGRLTAALERVGTHDALRALREQLLIDGFTRVAPDDYASLADSARSIDALGYPRLQ